MSSCNVVSLAKALRYLSCKRKGPQGTNKIPAGLLLAGSKLMLAYQLTQLVQLTYSHILLSSCYGGFR